MQSSEPAFSYDELVEALTLSQEYGFLSPQPIERQIEHSQELITFCPKTTGRAIDLGAGGGLPSLVWLHVDHEVSIIAIDAMKKRTDFLEEIASKYSGIGGRLTVVNGRAEEIAHKVGFREKYELVVARGFASPSTVAECAAGLIQSGGNLVVSGRPEGELERWNEEQLEKLGYGKIELYSGDKCHAVRIPKERSLEDVFPRKASAIKKKPLWV